MTAQVELQFAEDGYTFVGKWKDDSTGQWGDWRGRRIESVAEILAIPLRLLVRKKPAYCDHVRSLSLSRLSPFGAPYIQSFLLCRRAFRFAVHRFESLGGHRHLLQLKLGSSRGQRLTVCVRDAR